MVFLFKQIFSRAAETISRVSEKADASVAFVAKNAAYGAGDVVVIYLKPLSIPGVCGSADGTSATLIPKHLFIVAVINAKFSSQMASSIKKRVSSKSVFT